MTPSLCVSACLLFFSCSVAEVDFLLCLERNPSLEQMDVPLKPWVDTAKAKEERHKKYMAQARKESLEYKALLGDKRWREVTDNRTDRIDAWEMSVDDKTYYLKASGVVQGKSADDIARHVS